jgi:hypothetical protein
MNSIRLAICAWLKATYLNRTWQCFEGQCRDQFRDTNWNWFCRVWATMIGDKKVAVVLSHEGADHSAWRLFVDGQFIMNMERINIHFGSAADAMRAAEAYVAASRH